MDRHWTSPETVERDVTKKIEESVNTVEGVRHIESTSQEGLSTIVVNFNIGAPTLNASQDIRGKLETIPGNPPPAIGEPSPQPHAPPRPPHESVALHTPPRTPRGP